LPDFERFPVWVNLTILSVSAAIVWLAGRRLAAYCKMISEQTRAGQAVLGTALLGSIVSLPEMTMASTAAFNESPELAVNTLLGGIALAVLTLAIADAAVGAEPLSSDVVRPVVLLQGPLVVLMLVVAGAGIIAPDVLVVTAGGSTLAIAGLYVISILMVARYEKKRPWMPEPRENTSENRPDPVRARHASNPRPLPLTVIFTAFAALAVIVAGSASALVADVLARQTRLGASFVGFVLGGIITTLPEVSSTVGAIRLKQYEMAFGDAFGTNLFSITLLFVVDLIYPGGPILQEVGQFSLLAILLGIAVTTICVSGLIVRPTRAVFRMGFDSVLIMCTTAVGLVLLYKMR
jgi:cation:H+ antiporter